MNGANETRLRRAFRCNLCGRTPAVTDVCTPEGLKLVATCGGCGWVWTAEQWAEVRAQRLTMRGRGAGGGYEV